MDATAPVRRESISCDRSWQAESCHHAALKGSDCADPIASQGHDDQAEGVGDVTYGAEEIDAECGLSVRASGYEPIASAHDERSCRKPPFHRFLASVFEGIRWHAQPRVVSQQLHQCIGVALLPRAYQSVNDLLLVW